MLEEKVNDRLPRNTYGSNDLDTYAWPGGYPVYYVTADGSVLCSDCAKEQEESNLIEYGSRRGSPFRWENIVAADINYENPYLYCDRCNEDIECAYPPEDEDEKGYGV